MPDVSSSARPGALVIRSFRVVFALERRLFKVDRFRLPLAYGVPVRGIAYAAGVLLAMIVAGRVPVLGAVVGVLAPPLRYVALPVAVAAALLRVRVDGLPAHHAVRLWVVHHSSSRRRLGIRRDPGAALRVIVDPVVFLPDERGPALRRGVVVGARGLTVRVPVSGVVRGAALVLRQVGAGPLRVGRRVTIPAGGRVLVRS
jgi:hypothetical protein